MLYELCFVFSFQFLPRQIANHTVPIQPDAIWPGGLNTIPANNVAPVSIDTNTNVLPKRPVAAIDEVIGS